MTRKTTLARFFLVSLFSAGFVGIVLSMLLVYVFFIPGFQQIEDDSVTEHAVRVQQAMLQQLTTLHARAADWAISPQLTRWAEVDQHPESLPGQNDLVGGVDHVLLLRPDNTVEPVRTRHPVAVFEGLINQYWQMDARPMWGAATLGDGTPILFALEPVEDTDGQVQGGVLFAVNIDDNFAFQLSSITEVPVHFEPPQRQQQHRNPTIERASDATILGRFQVRNMRDVPVLDGVVTLPRPIHQRAGSMLLWSGVMLLVLMVLGVLWVFWLLRLRVLNRLGQMKETVNRIAYGRDLTVRIPPSHNDELTELACDFNHMVEAICDAQAELDLAREQAESANRAKSQFLANMSHEIRTPMTAILGYTELLEDARVDEHHRYQYLDIIRQNGDALLALLNDILDLSRIEAGQLRVHKTICELDELLGDVFHSMQLKAEEKGLALRLVFANEVPTRLRTDPYRLRQILVNLIGNAVKFTDQGSVTLEVRWLTLTNPQLEIKVRDTGIGMSDAQLTRIFEPFSQLDESDSRRHGGTGLGLAIARQLARSMGGDILAQSTPGEGSEFTLCIQVESVPEADHLAPETDVEKLLPRHAPAARKVTQLQGRALLVEDNPMNRLLVEKLLTRAGMEVVLAEQGAQACDIVAQDKAFDLVVMDMQMPVMDGYVAASKMRELGYGGPIVALTANVLMTDRRRSVEAGCDAFVGKPLKVDLFYAVCEKLLERGRSS